MAYTIRLRRQGGSMAATLPREVVQRMGVRAGQRVFLIEDAPGEFRLTPYDPEVAAALKAHDKAVAEYREVFRELAK